MSLIRPKHAQSKRVERRATVGVGRLLLSLVRAQACSCGRQPGAESVPSRSHPFQLRLSLVRAQACSSGRQPGRIGPVSLPSLPTPAQSGTSAGLLQRASAGADRSRLAPIPSSSGSVWCERRPAPAGICRRLAPIPSTPAGNEVDTGGVLQEPRTNFDLGDDKPVSTSLLYHALGLRGYHYQRTTYVGGVITFKVVQDPKTLRCPACGSRDLWCRGVETRTFRSVPFGLKNTLLEVDVQRVECKEAACGVVRQVHLSFADPK